MDEEMNQAIRERAYALWTEDGSPSDMELHYWLEAERELLTQSVAGEEDPYVALDETPASERQKAAETSSPQKSEN